MGVRNPDKGSGCFLHQESTDKIQETQTQAGLRTRGPPQWRHQKMENEVENSLSVANPGAYT